MRNDPSNTAAAPRMSRALAHDLLRLAGVPVAGRRPLIKSAKPVSTVPVATSPSPGVAHRVAPRLSEYDALRADISKFVAAWRAQK